MPYSRWRMPDCAETSSNVPFRRLRYKRCLAVAATRGSAIDPPSTRKMSIQPSSSKSKNSPPDPMISAKYLSGLAPLTCVTPTPAAAAMSRKTTSVGGGLLTRRQPRGGQAQATTRPIGPTASPHRSRARSSHPGDSSGPGRSSSSGPVAPAGRSNTIRCCVICLM